MTLADDLLSTVYDGRAKAGELGFRSHTVAVIVAHHEPDSGEELSTVLVALTEANGQPPRVKWLKDQAVPVGNVQPDVIQIGAVTPNAANLAILAPLRADMEQNIARHVVITGPHAPEGKKYRVINIDVSRPLGWKIRAISEDQALQGLGI